MALPTPNLDDRRFQDLVDDAKRLIAARCPEWTDHNVSDPGVTLVETFAFMVDELFYRLNRVPDRLYVSFLDLLGVSLYPPTAATADVVFWLTAARGHDVIVPLGTEVGTRRTEDEASIIFATTAEKTIPPRHLTHIGSQPAEFGSQQSEPGDQPAQFARYQAEPEAVVHDVARLDNEPVGAFSPRPMTGDCLLFGLNAPAGHVAISLRLDCNVRGVGVDPLDPPLAWEAWAGRGWIPCDVVADSTGGLNEAGEVVLVLPAEHAASVIGGVRAGWVRCRLVEAAEGMPTYSQPPVVRSATGATVGGVAHAVHASTVTDEVVGLSEGVPGQLFHLAARPVLSDGSDFAIEVGSGSGWDTWRETDSFAGGEPDDRAVVLDRTRGTIAFPPAVRESDGSLRRYGAVPPKGAPLRVPSYRIGGGRSGNVSAGSLSVLRTTIPFVRRTENRAAATGGTDGETVDEAKVRGPLELGARDRAVTVEDYEQLAKRAAPGVARVHCVPVSEASGAKAVRLLVVPTVAVDGDGRIEFDDLIPGEDLLATIRDDLDRRRAVGARVVIEPPRYEAVTVVASLVARPRASVESLREQSLRALYRHFDPVRGGTEGRGWTLGRAVQAGEVYAVLQALPGTEFIEEVLLFRADPQTRKRGEPVQRIDLDARSLVFSFEHRIRVKASV